MYLDLSQNFQYIVTSNFKPQNLKWFCWTRMTPKT